MILQHIVYKKIPYLDKKSFYKKNANCIATNTFFNIFSPALWLKQAKLSDKTPFYCNLEFQGSGCAYIIAVNEGFQEYIFKKLYVNNHGTFKIRLSSSYLYYYIVWEISLKLICGNYECKSSFPQNKSVRLCLVTVTYKRNNDIRRLIDTFNLFENKYKDYNLDLIIINNDNQSQINNIQKNNITEVVSKNTGGAGGFTNGLKIAISRNKYTNILLCDDDIVLHPETIYRTFSLLQLTFNRNYIISGAMFETEDQNFCHCIFESLNMRGHHQNILGRIKLDTKEALNEAIIKMIKLSDYEFKKQYAAWWYCCIPTELIKKSGFPLQFFIRGDDQEYGIRLQAKIVTVNGIQVWHPAFSSKRSILRDYLGNRNYAIINIIHYEKYITNIVFHFFVKFYRAINDKDYLYASVLALALHYSFSFNNKEEELDNILRRIYEVKNRKWYVSFFSIAKSLLILFVKGSQIKARLNGFITK